MKKLLLATFFGIYFVAPQYAQTVEKEINGDELKVNFLRKPAPSYAWDFAGGIYGSIKQDIISQFVVISNNKEGRNYDFAYKGLYNKFNLPQPIVLMSNASRNLFAYSDAQNNVYISSYMGIKLHKIANKKAVEAIAVGLGSENLAVATQNEAGKSVINLYKHNWEGLKQAQALVGHKEKVENLIFSESDAKLLSCTEEEIIVWDTESGKILHRFVPKIANLIANARKAAVADAANIIAYAGYNKIIVADLDKNTSSEIKLGALPNDFRFSKDGQFLYTAHEGVFIKYAAATGEVVKTIDVNKPNTVCHLSPNSLYALLISTEDNLLQVIHLAW